MDNLLNPHADAVENYGVIASMEQRIDDLTKKYRENMLQHIQKGTCSGEGSILYSEILRCIRLRRNKNGTIYSICFTCSWLCNAC